MKTSPIAQVVMAIIAAFTMLIPDKAAIAQVVVNYQFRQNGNVNSTEFTGVGAAPDAGTFWNQVDFTSVSATSMVYTLPGTIFASDGVTASVSTISSFTPTGTTVDSVGMFADGTVPSKSNALTDTFLLAFDDEVEGRFGSFTMTIGGLTAGGEYDLYFYAQNSHSYSDVTDFTIGATTQNVDNRGITVPDQIAGNYLLAPGANNYTVFSSVLADGSGNIDVLVTSPDFEAAFNGFQIVTVPEPGTFVLILSGAMGLLVCKLKRIRRVAA